MALMSNVYMNCIRMNSPSIWWLCTWIYLVLSCITRTSCLDLVRPTAINNQLCGSDSQPAGLLLNREGLTLPVEVSFAFQATQNFSAYVIASSSSDFVHGSKVFLAGFENGSLIAEDIGWQNSEHATVTLTPMEFYSIRVLFGGVNNSLLISVNNSVMSSLQVDSIPHDLSFFGFVIGGRFGSYSSSSCIHSFDVSANTTSSSDSTNIILMKPASITSAQVCGQENNPVGAIIADSVTYPAAMSFIFEAGSLKAMDAYILAFDSPIVEQAGVFWFGVESGYVQIQTPSNIRDSPVYGSLSLSLRVPYKFQAIFARFNATFEVTNMLSGKTIFSTTIVIGSSFAKYGFTIGGRTGVYSKWSCIDNFRIDTITLPDDEEQSPLIRYLYILGPGAGVIIIFAVVCICCCIRNRNKDNPPQRLGSGNSGGGGASPSRNRRASVGSNSPKRRASRRPSLPTARSFKNISSSPDRPGGKSPIDDHAKLSLALPSSAMMTKTVERVDKALEMDNISDQI